MRIKLSELRHIVKSIIKEESSQESKRKLTNVIKQVVREQMYLKESIVPEEILKKISPCLLKVGLENLDSYPQTSKLIMKMIAEKELPTMFDPALIAVVTEVTSKIPNVTSLLKFLECIAKALQIQY